MLIERSENVAMPLLAVWTTVPDNVPAAGLVPIAAVIVADDVVTVFPPASWTVTTTAGLITDPATTAVGGWEYTTFVAGPTATSKVLLIVVVNPTAVAVRV